LANQENEEEESYEDDGGIDEVIGDVVRVEESFECPGQCNLPHSMFLMSSMTFWILPWLNCCFSQMTSIQLMTRKLK